VSLVLTFVRGDTRTPLRWPVRENGAIVNVTGWSAYARAVSMDLPGVVIDNLAGAVADGPNGIFEWASFGNTISSGQMGTRKRVRFTAQLHAVDLAGEIAYTEEFELVFVAPV
jgi:hypothetical protein